ncbi:Uncharacterised protein [Mesomycoplasma conjunctivae]|uniref:Uncharacterized protein n=1 Tax=Mesomycoplasma conjunctivae (strain ATCC 25834 / NCTC 10147 / HRC/581) TaxID=572263 RepID=C5J6S5_MESCH|nr:hypothetical protein [Mesomycoplasma conjunctivae]CAT05188.1 HYPOTHETICAL PROTEIN MCJ_004830 [Mesomycoplasma conjunctivae]VEU66193.1 Uncharacterised protein [Mesomycoplasma conjunctivae]VEU66399.1 Uncharacterised protein [Mesomycoplasma conjunctivae]
MALGKLVLKISAVSDQFDKEMEKVSNRIKDQVQNFKKHFNGLAITSFIFKGADAAINEYRAKMQLLSNFGSFGLSQAEELTKISDAFERIGYSADVANQSFLEFVTTGSIKKLKTMGIFLDANTSQKLRNASAQERLNYVLREGMQEYQRQAAALPENIRTLTEFKKESEDLQKNLGMSFLSALTNITKAFGGLQNAMKIAIAAFTAYKMAMIIGNVAIAVSKALAMGSIFSAPIAFAMGAAALGSLLALGTGAGLAISSIGSPPGDNADADANKIPVAVQVDIKNDKYDAPNHTKKYNQGTY